MNARDRLAFALYHCAQIGSELEFSLDWISKETINPQWVAALAENPVLKERVSGFISRFGRFQDYFSDKVIRYWLAAVGENVGTALDNFGKAEAAGIIKNSESFIEYRILRNKVSHEYIDNTEEFSIDLSKAISASMEIMAAFDSLVSYSRDKLGIDRYAGQEDRPVRQ